MTISLDKIVPLFRCIMHNCTLSMGILNYTVQIKAQRCSYRIAIESPKSQNRTLNIPEWNYHVPYGGPGLMICRVLSVSSLVHLPVTLSSRTYAAYTLYRVIKSKWYKNKCYSIAQWWGSDACYAPFSSNLSAVSVTPTFVCSSNHCFRFLASGPIG